MATIININERPVDIPPRVRSSFEVFFEQVVTSRATLFAVVCASLALFCVLIANSDLFHSKGLGIWSGIGVGVIMLAVLGVVYWLNLFDRVKLLTEELEWHGRGIGEGGVCFVALFFCYSENTLEGCCAFAALAVAVLFSYFFLTAATEFGLVSFLLGLHNVTAWKLEKIRWVVWPLSSLFLAVMVSIKQYYEGIQRAIVNHNRLVQQRTWEQAMYDAFRQHSNTLQTQVNNLQSEVNGRQTELADLWAQQAVMVSELNQYRSGSLPTAHRPSSSTGHVRRPPTSPPPPPPAPSSSTAHVRRPPTALVRPPTSPPPPPPPPPPTAPIPPPASAPLRRSPRIADRKQK